MLIRSDVKNIELDYILKLWIAQFMEEAVFASAKNIEVWFYRKGLNGFDIIYDNEGVPDDELPNICCCLEFRQRNELYKNKSIGYRGEAYNSLAKSSTLSIITKHSQSKYAWKVVYNHYGEMASVSEYPSMTSPGTIIQVRYIHKWNETYRNGFIKRLETSYAQAIRHLI